MSGGVFRLQEMTVTRSRHTGKEDQTDPMDVVGINHGKQDKITYSDRK